MNMATLLYTFAREAAGCNRAATIKSILHIFRIGERRESSTSGLKFQSDDQNAVTEDVDKAEKWKTVVFSNLPDDKKRSERTSTKDNVNSLKKKFECSSMKDNEAYVIM